jgi:hypothetical protein
MNSRTKGKRGEREFAALLREQGFDARRGQQFAGGAESPDVVSEALGWLHVEVKRVQHLNLADACAQAEGDAGGKPWIVAHRRNHAPWLITLRAETFFQLLRGDLPPAGTATVPQHISERPQRAATDFPAPGRETPARCGCHSNPNTERQNQ